MSGPMYPACIHHAYANDLRGVWLREPCWIPGCPGARPHPDMIPRRRAEEQLMSLPIEPDDLSVLAEPHMGTRRYIEPEQLRQLGTLPAGWCWCADNWLIAGIEDFKEGGKLHSREGCWPRDRATRIHGLPGALDTTFPCCEHCPCHGMDHAVPCPIDGCEGQIGS